MATTAVPFTTRHEVAPTDTDMLSDDERHDFEIEIDEQSMTGDHDDEMGDAIEEDTHNSVDAEMLEQADNNLEPNEAEMWDPTDLTDPTDQPGNQEFEDEEMLHIDYDDHDGNNNDGDNTVSHKDNSENKANSQKEKDMESKDVIQSSDAPITEFPTESSNIRTDIDAPSFLNNGEGNTTEETTTEAYDETTISNFVNTNANSVDPLTIANLPAQSSQIVSTNEELGITNEESDIHKSSAPENHGISVEDVEKDEITYEVEEVEEAGKVEDEKVKNLVTKDEITNIIDTHEKDSEDYQEKNDDSHLETLNIEPQVEEIDDIIVKQETVKFDNDEDENEGENKDENSTQENYHESQDDYSYDMILEYKGDELSLFPPSHTGLPETYLLQDQSIADKYFNEFFVECRKVLGDSISEQESLELEIPSLSLFIHEDSLECSNNSLAHVIDVNYRLHQNDGINQPNPLTVILKTRLKFNSRLSSLFDAADAAIGISSINGSQQPKTNVDHDHDETNDQNHENRQTSNQIESSSENPTKSSPSSTEQLAKQQDEDKHINDSNDVAGEEIIALENKGSQDANQKNEEEDVDDLIDYSDDEEDTSTTVQDDYSKEISDNNDQFHHEDVAYQSTGAQDDDNHTQLDEGSNDQETSLANGENQYEQADDIDWLEDDEIDPNTTKENKHEDEYDLTWEDEDEDENEDKENHDNLKVDGREDEDGQIHKTNQRPASPLGKRSFDEHIEGFDDFGEDLEVKRLKSTP